MSNRDRMELDGVVVSANKSIFKIKVPGNEQDITCTVSGKIRVNCVKILEGDRVRIEVTPYDPARGRIIFRHKQ